MRRVEGCVISAQVATVPVDRPEVDTRTLRSKGLEANAVSARIAGDDRLP